MHFFKRFLLNVSHCLENWLFMAALPLTDTVNYEFALSRMNNAIYFLRAEMRACTLEYNRLLRDTPAEAWTQVDLTEVVVGIEKILLDANNLARHYENLIQACKEAGVDTREKLYEVNEQAIKRLSTLTFNEVMGLLADNLLFTF